MKKTMLTLSLSVLLLMTCYHGFAQDDASMKKWMDYMTPAENHKMLAKSTGIWQAEYTMWMSPDAPPMKTAMTCENKMLMDGRYQQSVFKGNMMGMPFEGMSTIGYDNIRKVFISTWIDNMGTGLTYMEGTYDSKTKTLTSSGKMVDAEAGQELAIREVFVLEDDNHHTMTMYNTKGGQEVKVMEVKLTRKM